MNVRLLFSVLALTVLGAGCVAGASAGAGYPLRSQSASAQAAGPAQPELQMFSTKPSLGVRATTDIGFAVPATAAEPGKLTLYVPAGYGFDIAAVPGTPEGHVAMRTASDIGFGELKAANPANYLNTPQAQACAPGSNSGTAVWIMHFDEGFFSTQTLTVPIYIDPTSGDETTLGAYKLQACLPLAKRGSPGGWPVGSRLRALVMEFTHLTNPTSPAIYVWRGFVSNPDVNGNPDPSTMYELRADIPLPAKLSLTGTYDRKDHRARLSGQLTTPAMPVAGVPVSLFRQSNATFNGWAYQAETRTATTGSYRFIRAVRKTTTFGVAAGATVGDCTGESVAPTGCISESLAEIDSPNVRIVVRRHH
jgi:hypothetical protein